MISHPDQGQLHLQINLIILLHFRPALSCRLPEEQSASKLHESSVAPSSSAMGESFCQSVVHSPPADIKEECQSFTINCVFYGGFFAYPLRRGEFFKQTPTGTKRERILSGGRFVVRTNKAEKTFSLEVQDVNVKDTATYYCKAWYEYSTQ
ncbi:hypothetical protein chiPu_0021285 [Chiloscyllium punctatum]|uniref:Immunoglobulin V-set domain-containing protein n=1 Tax=Chiloscyllium punctatum TaxID=137246 RepID=A0A401RR61_CHIPU|nr:hypothetical protein [Chiloscyllium punctatum]